MSIHCGLSAPLVADQHVAVLAHRPAHAGRAVVAPGSGFIEPAEGVDVEHVELGLGADEQPVSAVRDIGQIAAHRVLGQRLAEGGEGRERPVSALHRQDSSRPRRRTAHRRSSGPDRTERKGSASGHQGVLLPLMRDARPRPLRDACCRASCRRSGRCRAARTAARPPCCACRSRRISSPRTGTGCGFSSSSQLVSSGGTSVRYGMLLPVLQLNRRRGHRQHRDACCPRMMKLAGKPP